MDDPIIVRVEITPGSVMLGALGESYPLTAQAFNAAGLEVDAEFAWTSSHPENISVDTDGLLTAMGMVGSATITAEADGIRSIPATVLVVVPAPNSQFVDDSQVVGDFALVDPEAEFVPGVLYTVTLTGIDPPPIGTILLGREEAPVGGKVVDAQVTNGDVVVTLELLTLDELFAELKIDQSYDLSNVEAQISEDAVDFYAMERQPDGSYVFTVLPDAPVDEKAKFPLGPFECETTLPITPLTFDALPLTFGLTIDLDFILNYDSSQGGLQKIAVKGSAKAQFKVSPTMTAAFEAKIECKMELLTLTVPIGGPLALIFGGQIPVGAGFAVGGKLTIAQVGAEVSTEASATAEIGVQCPGGSNCTMLNTLTSDTKADYKWLLPNSANVLSNLRLEPSLSGFLFIKMAIGNRFFSALRLDAFIIKGGADSSRKSVHRRRADLGCRLRVRLQAHAGPLGRAGERCRTDFQAHECQRHQARAQN
ncbi:MAG: hypothetical protein JRF42_02250 [Deltaproteobacteria bacterium]|nr:hypothetical protein [Deltaproteobacteria bacterium]